MFVPHPIHGYPILGFQRIGWGFSFPAHIRRNQRDSSSILLPQQLGTRSSTAFESSSENATLI